MDFLKTTKMIYLFIMISVFLFAFFFLIAPDSSAEKSSIPVSESKQPISNVQNILAQSGSISSAGQIVYGKSGLGENLICNKISPDFAAKAKILVTYEIHGYEDVFPKDGQMLVDIGSLVSNYFTGNRNLLDKCELYIVESANPDGLSHGNTENGAGRCQVSLGIDMNRDFNYNFQVYNDSRNLTQSQPFAAPETQALKDLVDALKPDAVIDCHGWENDLIGDKWLAGFFKESMNIHQENDFSVNNHGYFSAWAGTQGAKSLLIEYPIGASRHSADYANDTIAGLQQLMTALSS